MSPQDILAAGHKVVFFLRSVSAFEKDATMKPFIESKQAILIEGDGLNKESVENAWKLANQESFVNLVLFTVGTYIPLATRKKERKGKET